MTFEHSQREMFTELFGLLAGVDDEWRSQGASENEINLSAFGFGSVLHTSAACSTGAITGIKPYVIEDNAELTISVDKMGRTEKLHKKSATIPLPVEYPVKTIDDWLQIKHWYAFNEKRINIDQLAHTKKMQDEGWLICASIPGGFDEPRQLMGDEALCIAFYDTPELIIDILNTISDTALKVFERVFNVLTIDNLCVHEDMAGKNGPLAGPLQVKEFIHPYYRKIWDECARHGSKLFSQDSDSNMNTLIDIFLDAGINIMYPFEPNSGMDMVEVRKKYGNRLAIKGGLDKFILRGTKEDIRKELEYKICPETLGGGTIFAIDHRIPNGSSIENYRYYHKLRKELLGIPNTGENPYIRMAF